MERSGVGFGMFYTPWKTNMEPDNPWLVEENQSSMGPGRQGLCEFSGV